MQGQQNLENQVSFLKQYIQMFCPFYIHSEFLNLDKRNKVELAWASEDYAVGDYLRDVLLYGVLGAVCCFHTQMVEYDDEVCTDFTAYVLFTPQHKAFFN